MLFHTLSLGEVSVDAFFLLSGYLITKSMVRTERLVPFLERRALRIYPAFAMAYLLSVFVLGPLVGADVWSALPSTAINLILMHQPAEYAGQLSGLHTYPFLNGSLWTISYEFNCYLLVALLGVIGLLRHRWIVLILTISSLVISVLAKIPDITVMPQDIIRFTSIFMVGMCWFLFKDEMQRHVTAKCAFLCAAICIISLYYDPYFAELGLTLFGRVMLYWISFKAEIGVLQRINDQWDVSYGTYLYGWPIAIYLVWRVPSISPWIVAIVALPLALLAGAASWWGLERWTKDIVRSKSRPRVVLNEPVASQQIGQQRA